MNYPALRAELLLTTPVNYPPMTDQAAADQLNSLATGRTLPRRAVSKNEILNAIVDSEWPTTAILQNKLLCIFCCDSVDASNTNTRAIFAAIFGGATTTRANLLALGSQTVSRATELGLEAVTALDVNRARLGVW